MTASYLWRGQVPAWQCDSDGRWNLRFAAGAFEEAGLVRAALTGDAPRPMDLHLDPTQRPKAGSMVAIRVMRRAGPVGQLDYSLVDIASGTMLMHGTAEAGADATDMSIETATAGTAAGPLGMVNAWDCDVMHHMNVQFYAGRATEAEAALGAHLGFDPAGSEGPWLRPVEHRFRFSSEMSAGDAIAAEIFSGGRTANGIQARIELRNLVNGKAAASIESDLEWAGANPPDSATMREAHRRFDALPRVEGKPAWTGGDWAPDAATLERMTPLGRQEVLPWEVDHTGVMPPRFLFGRTGSSVPYLLDQMGLNRPYMLANRFGRVAVGYRLRYLRWPKSGDCLELRSGVSEVGEKTWRFRHGFIDISNGALVCSVDAIVLLFSMTERRSVPLPADIHARAERMSI